MALMSRFLERNLRNSNGWGAALFRAQSTQTKANSYESEETEEEFRVLNLRPNKAPQRAKRRTDFKMFQALPPRAQRMAVDQDWTAVWPGPKTFHPASVPLPIRQGFTEKGAPAPSKYANAELMKIPNFLHLTPPAVRQQCEAIKKFCTAWPAELDTDEKIKEHFPVEVISTDYCHALPTIRHPEARRVTLKVKLSNFKFDAHAKDKFLRLVGDRYDSETDILTIVGDRCPMRKQNYDYAMYLLTACYHESFITEPWEASKSEADMETYHFERNKSKESCENILNYGKPSDAPKQTASQGFVHSLEQLINDGENEYNLTKYKEEAVKMLGLEKK